LAKKYETIKLPFDGPVATIRLNRSDVLNSDTTKRLMEQEDLKEFYLGIARDVSVKGYKRYKKKTRWR